jgi:hypothetical protein
MENVRVFWPHSNRVKCICTQLLNCLKYVISALLLKKIYFRISRTRYDLNTSLTLHNPTRGRNHG